MSGQVRQILEARSRAISQKGETAPAAVASLTLFRLRGQLYAARAEEVEGAGQLRDLSPVPGAPGWLIGATLFRGQVVSLIDLPGLWNVQAHGIRDLPSYVVLSAGGRRLGILVDQLLGNLELEGRIGAYEGPARSGLAELARRDGEPLPVLSARALFSDPRLNP